MTGLIALMPLPLLAGAYLSCRYGWWRRPVPDSCPRILMYHMIQKPVPGARFNSLRLDPATFERQLKYLGDQGYHFFTMSELVAATGTLPDKSVAITFDDGYADNCTAALPLLRKYRARATLYLVVDRHDREWSTKRKPKHRGGELRCETKLSDGQVVELVRSGLVEIGSHTCTHDNLPTLSRDQKHYEIAISRERLEALTSRPCTSFCYPFGLFDQTDVELVKKAGYTNAVTVEKGIDDLRGADPFRLRRITISGKDNFYAFKLKLRTGKRGLKK